MATQPRNQCGYKQEVAARIIPTTKSYHVFESGDEGLHMSMI